MHRSGFKCQCCGAKPSDDNDVTLEVDHIVPVSKGGSDFYDNLQVLCKKCNIGKHNNFAYDHNKDIDLWKI
jgi:5-methylcytosine-specific restriction endonuclease McrA